MHYLIFLFQNQIIKDGDKIDENSGGITADLADGNFGSVHQLENYPQFVEFVWNVHCCFLSIFKQSKT